MSGTKYTAKWDIPTIYNGGLYIVIREDGLKFPCNEYYIYINNINKEAYTSPLRETAY